MNMLLLQLFLFGLVAAKQGPVHPLPDDAFELEMTIRQDCGAGRIGEDDPNKEVCEELLETPPNAVHLIVHYKKQCKTLTDKLARLETQHLEAVVKGKKAAELEAMKSIMDGLRAELQTPFPYPSTLGKSCADARLH